MKGETIKLIPQKIKRNIRDYFEKLFANILSNLKETGTSQNTCCLPILN